ncbi:MAG: TadE/TadG family type IV pilus assembly protein, partial [Alphaproteobacteria bacterium]
DILHYRLPRGDRAVIGPIATRLARLRRAQDGVSAVEFALIVPVLLFLYLGAAEAAQALMAHRRAAQSAAVVAELVSQSRTVGNATIGQIFAAGELVVAPFSTVGMTQRITSLAVGSDGVARVQWSDARNGTARPAGAAVALPPGVAFPDETLIMAEIGYAYASPLGLILPNLLSFDETAFVRPRFEDRVLRQ